jgi:hypothetical protein
MLLILVLPIFWRRRVLFYDRGYLEATQLLRTRIITERGVSGRGL